jgi:hypothetical protein
MGTDSIVGLFALGAVGLFTIAAIYQLGKTGNPIVPAASTDYQATLSGIFK